MEQTTQDIDAGLTNLLRLCEQTRIYCDIACENIDDRELCGLLRKITEERRVILIEVARYLRSRGCDPREYFSSVFYQQQILEPQECPIELTGVLCSIYLSEQAMSKVLSRLKNTEDHRLKALVLRSARHSNHVKETLSLIMNRTTSSIKH